MKQYVIDELRPVDYEKIKEYMDEHFEISSMGGLYWIDLDQEILNDAQKGHVDCQRQYFAAELSDTGLCCELLARSRNRLKCDCMTYADERQRTWLVNLIDSMLEELEIKI